MDQEVILVVDDNHQIADVTAGSILPSLGYSALVAYGSYPALDIIRQHHSSLLANMARKLRAVPEGDGDMLDNTMILYFSDAANKHHADCLEWPYVVIGGCGGKLKIPGYSDYLP